MKGPDVLGRSVLVKAGQPTPEAWEGCRRLLVPTGQVGPEASEIACSDGFDNDGDGAIDCEDDDCEGNMVNVCHGSLEQPEPPHTPSPIPI